MGTSGMGSHLFTVPKGSSSLSSSSTSTDAKVQSNEVWKPPAELAHLLTVSAKERKAAPKRGMSHSDHITNFFLKKLRVNCFHVARALHFNIQLFSV
jgi:hypothetical protein